jgi:hypothetical protein
MMQRTSVQSCQSSDAGLRVVPDSSQLCAIAMDSRRRAASTEISADWGSLAIGPCILISMSNAYCYNVPGYSYLVVGMGIMQLSSSSSGGRRLLYTTTDPGDLVLQVDALGSWNETSQPCRSLAKNAENLTSISDIESLKNCIHWRSLGHSCIEKFNFTSLSLQNEDDAFLVSWTDFIRIVGSRKGAAVQVASSIPQLAVYIIQESGLKTMLERISRALYRTVLVEIWPLMALARKNATLTAGNNSTEAASEDRKMDFLHSFVLSQHRALSIFQVSFFFRVFFSFFVFIFFLSCSLNLEFFRVEIHFHSWRPTSSRPWAHHHHHLISWMT